ncbi:MAG TPA: helix-turn-helix domain-containing protein [Allosphingosinicella sp.]|jgi:AraC-like DNA-binding protein|nr:helix-turn-helix domain-containing protein [Allosphingosinicella sp.]
MRSKHELDRLLVTMDVAVQHFAVCEVKSGRRLVGAPVDAIMVHYVLAGTMHMTIPGQETIICGPGCVALIPPGMQPSMTADGGPATEVIGVEHASVSRDGLLVMDAADGGPGDLRLAAGIVLASMSGSFGLLDKLKVPIAENMSDSEIVRDCYSLMLAEIAQPGLGTRALTAALMKTCLLMVLRRFFGRPGADQALIGALADPRLASAVAMVLDKPSAPHCVASLAARASMSRSTFARQFNEAFQMSPMEFVAKTRLYHAAELLRSTKLPIKVVAASIGFSSRSHFSRAFRDAYGSDPSQFRNAEGETALDAPRRLRGSRARFGLSEEPA